MSALEKQMPIRNPCLAPVNPADYRFAVHCCGYKWDLTDKPDRAVALFEHSSAALKFGQVMWPSTFEVVDRFTGETVVVAA